MIKKFSILLLAVTMFTTASCGTILKNGQGGRTQELDLQIVALDSIGLLFFLVPGVLSFAIDFNNKTIYR